MIKFKKMTTAAKVASGVGVTAVAGVAIIPIINTGVDNPKSKVSYYQFHNTFYKSKDDAEAARAKLTALSGLVQIMDGKKVVGAQVDYKPLMAEFISFVSKLFVVKVFDMDKETKGDEHFKYDGMTEQQKNEIMQKEIQGQIQYGDLSDITSLVKYATANKVGTEWMFTPVDEMMLSVLGDGSGQAFSQSELDYATISKTIEKLKVQYDTFYKKQITDDFEGTAYSLVNGLVHHKDDELEMADVAKSSDPNVNNGDGSGDLYKQELITNYQQWGTLKAALETSKKDLDDFIALPNMNEGMKPILQKMITENAQIGWNNKERYSTDEIQLRDLLARVATEQSQYNSQVIPGGHVDTSVSIIRGWNWKATGDQSGRDYKQWQLDLARDMQEREKLLSLGLVPAVPGAVEGDNPSATGDGSGHNYAQSVLDLKSDLGNVGTSIADLTRTIDTLVNQNVVAAPTDGEEGLNGQHEAATGLKDDKDYSNSWAIYQEYLRLQKALADAQKAHDDFDNSLKNVMLNVKPGAPALANGDPDKTGVHSEFDLIHTIVSFDTAIQGANLKQNYNFDQVDLKNAKALKPVIQKMIDDLKANGIIPAPDGAKADNSLGTGDKTGHSYTAEQIKLRDLKAQYVQVDTAIDQAKAQSIRQAKTNGIPDPDPLKHEALVGLGNGQTYLQYFVDAATQYRSYKSTLDDINAKIKVLEDKYKTSPGGFTTAKLEALHTAGAQVGPNTGVQYTQKEIDVTAQAETLKTLQGDLTTASKALDQLSNGLDADHLSQLRDDQAKGIVPKVGPNIAPGGDASGHNYEVSEVSYHKAMEMLKLNFPEGNPWWTTTTDKKSDAAYEALFNDWTEALKIGTQVHNIQKVGDGTDHKFIYGNLAAFNIFYRNSLVNTLQDVDGKDPTGKAMVSAKLDVILNYMKKYGTLDMPNGVDYPLNSENHHPGVTAAARGDGTGHTYIEIASIQDAMQRAYVSTTGHPSAFKNVQNFYDTYSKIQKNQSPASIQAIKDRIAAQQQIIDNIDGAQALKEIARKAAVQEMADKDDFQAQQQNAINDFVRKVGYPFNTYTPNEIRGLAAEKVNHAKLLTPAQSKILSDADQLGALIPEEQNAASAAYTAWSNVVNTNYNMYLWYQKNLGIVDKIESGPNISGAGNKSGINYTPEQIDGRDTLNKIKGEIANPAHGISSAADQKAELTKILSLQDSSSLGLNHNGSDGKYSGDTTGKSYDQWELDLYTSVKHMRDVESKLGSKAFAPDGAPMINTAPRGAGNDETYTDAQVDFIKMFTPLVNAKKTTAEKVDKDTKEKARLDAEIKAQGIDPKNNHDPAVEFVTAIGQIYPIGDYNAAKHWVELETELSKRQAALATAKAASGVATTASNTYKNGHQDARRRASRTIRSQKALLKQVTAPNALANAGNAYTAANDAFDKSADYLLIQKWFNQHKGELVDQDSSDKRFGSMKVASTMTDFIDPKKSGSWAKIIAALNNVGANTDGSENTKAAHTEDQLDLRDALKQLIKYPSTQKRPRDSEFPTKVFDTLFGMYGNAIESGYWKAPANYAKIEHTDLASIYVDQTTTTDKKRYQLYLSAGFAQGTDIDSKVLTIDDFKKWLLNYFTKETGVTNIKPTGTGSGVSYNPKFFSYNTNPLTKDTKPLTKDTILFSELGRAAKVVGDYNGVKQTTGVGWTSGLNSAGTGDKSGKYYSPEEFAYYKKYAEVQEDTAKAAAQQKIVDGFGIGVIHAPKGYTGKGVATHQEPVGDGSGNSYLQETIDDANTWASLQRQLKTQTDLIADMKTKYELHKGGLDYRPWSEVQTVDSAVAPGFNHDTYWSAAELAYNGKVVLGKTLAKNIADLENGAPVSPTGAGVSGTPTTPGAVKLKPAPDGAIEGLNEVPTGLADGTTFDQKQIYKRDQLKAYYEDLAATDKIIKDLTVKLTTEGVSEAPASVIDGGVDIAHWQKDPVGDGTGNTYSKDLFDDRAKLQLLQDAKETAEKARDTFIKAHGQTAIDTILDEVARGMVDGINNKEKYSASEIALRDHTAARGTAQNHLNAAKTASGYGIAIQLSDKAIAGENIKAKGAANDKSYSKEEIHLRELIAKIRQEEIDHGINPDAELTEMAKMNTYDSTQTDKTAAATSVETTLQTTVYETYTNINLISAIVGANHFSIGDGTGLYYDKGDIDTFTDISALAARIAKDNQDIKDLKDKGISPAPIWGLPVTAAEATLAGDPTLAGKHKLPVGDKSGKIYTAADITQAQTYVKLQKAFDDATKALSDFVAKNATQVKFFEFKLQGKAPGQKDTAFWNPIVGRNWASYNFELRDKFDERAALKVGKTMVNTDPTIPTSAFGTNRGHLGDETSDQRLVMYKGDKKYIKTEILGSDQARIGYVLSPKGATTIDKTAPVLTSLKNVANYLQLHPELISKELMAKFGLLGASKLFDGTDPWKITEETVSKDTFRTMQENYEWGDK